ncbi:MAG: hypothetical protein ACP5E5_01025 [Acidobacteriaceae bacterium]
MHRQHRFFRNGLRSQARALTASSAGGRTFSIPVLCLLAASLFPTCIASWASSGKAPAAGAIGSFPPSVSPSSAARPATLPSSSPPGTPLSWAQQAAHNETILLAPANRLPLQFEQTKVNDKGYVTKEVIVSRQGNVTRLIQSNGKPITAAQNAAEISRLQQELADPSKFLWHRSKDDKLRSQILHLVVLMPQAMLFSYAPGQPQPNNASGPQIVLDFRPNPSFHPPTMVTNALLGLEGRVWIDARTHYLTRIQGHILQPVDMGFGLVARIYPGGTLELEQTDLGHDHWVFSHMEYHLTMRLFLLKNSAQNVTITSWDFHSLPAMPSYQDGIRNLLATHVPVR